jgi:hypothetical protein
MVRHRFHLAFPVYDLQATREFYVERLGARVGRTDARWIDLDLFGHQLTAHLVEFRHDAPPTNPVDGEDVPARHFGVILTLPEWASLRDQLTAAGVTFLIEPQVRFQGQPGEQATLFVLDPAGNALEFKAFADDGDVFRTV